MVSREELDNLRALARQRHRAATRKVSRLKSNFGVEISGQKQDPRRDLGNLKRYNAKQLESYINQLDQFTSRQTGYVAGAKDRPINAGLWRQYKTLERALNQKNAKPFETIKDKFVPTLGMTIGEFMPMKPAHPTTGNPATRAPHLPVDRSPRGVKDDRSIRRLISDAKKKLGEDYTDHQFRLDRKVADKMLKDIGNVSHIKDIQKAVKGFSAKEFQTLWHYLNFADIASLDYAIAKSKLHDKKAMSAWDSAFDTQISQMRKLIKDVKQLDL